MRNSRCQISVLLHKASVFAFQSRKLFCAEFTLCALYFLALLFYYNDAYCVAYNSSDGRVEQSASEVVDRSQTKDSKN